MQQGFPIFSKNVKLMVLDQGYNITLDGYSHDVSKKYSKRYLRLSNVLFSIIDLNVKILNKITLNECSKTKNVSLIA